MATKTFKIGLSNEDKATMQTAVENAVIEDFEQDFAKKDGEYENLWAGNLITDQNWRWVNTYQFGTGDVDTVFNGEATIHAIRGRTSWSGTTPSYVNVVSNKSVIFNLFKASDGYAHVVESDDENNGLCVYGTGITTSTVLEFSESSDFSNPSDVSLTSATNSTGETYLHCSVIANGYLRIKNATAPNDFCVANVWGGNRVSYHPEYEEDTCTINSATYFPTGMKGITVDGEEVVYDEMYANVYYTRVSAYSFGATPSVSYVAASGTYNIYRMSLSSAMNKGACEIGGSTKFAWSDVGQMSSSTPLSADTMSLYTNYIYFAIAQSEDTTYTYSQDTAVVDQASFESQSAIHTLYTESGGVYTEATEYVGGTTYYYVSATNLHGLNGQAIIDEIKNKVIVYQIKSMSTTTYTGTAISPALDWTYKMGDFGTEELILASGYTVVPNWVVYYPINVLETVQQLPNNYVSLESAESMLHQVGELQGFDFDSITVDEDTGNMKVNGLVDTKETIVDFDTFGGSTSPDLVINSKTLNKIYYIPSIDALWFCLKFNITTTRYGYQCGITLGEKASEFFGGYFENVNNTGVVAYVDGETASFPIRIKRHNQAIWKIELGSPKNYTSKDLIINAIVRKN